MQALAVLPAPQTTHPASWMALRVRSQCTCVHFATSASWYMRQAQHQVRCSSYVISSSEGVLATAGAYN
jgi:hypothetical protein